MELVVRYLWRALNGAGGNYCSPGSDLMLVELEVTTTATGQEDPSSKFGKKYKSKSVL